MKIVLSNYHYHPGHSGGGDLHIEAFVHEAARLGHRLFSLPSCRHPSVHPIRPDALGQWQHLRDADVHYLRLQDNFPRRKISRWFTPPWRSFAPRPALVWEFNTIPEQGACIGLSPAEIALARQHFRHAAPYCDLAVCVSQSISDYVHTELGVARTLVIPNGAHLRPPAPHRTGPDFDVIWAGSAYIGWHAFDLLRDTARLLHDDPAAARIRFHLFGPGTETLAGLPPNVRTYGPVPHAEVCAASARMHAALCLYEPGPADYSSPLKFYDGLAAGLPVITTPQSQMDAVQNEMGASGLIVADRLPATFARILTTLADDEALLRRHSAAAQHLVATRYTWTSLMNTLLGEVAALVQSRRTG
ncbi:MAG: glycosyltransferase [Burkholderiales bacterium]|nr:glycosyltransferase [Opitutaceae bacterium]